MNFDIPQLLSNTRTWLRGRDPAARSSGATVATLQARPLAQPIYERLGFVTVSSYRLFSL